MEIDIRNLINAEVGHKETYQIDEEDKVELGDESEMKAVRGKVDLVALENEILAVFDLKVMVSISCARCLEGFEQELHLTFERKYGFEEGEDKIKIDNSLKIEVAEPIREETILNLPMKAICKEGCGGNEFTN